MTPERWQELMDDQASRLTPEEVGEGWHFCPDWDFLLIGPGMEIELKCCTCPKT